MRGYALAGLALTSKTHFENGRNKFLLFFVTYALLALAATAFAKPTLGFNIWYPLPHDENPATLVAEIDAMHAAGFRRVVLIPFVYADRTSGRVRADWPGDGFASMTDAELTAAVKHAKTLKMTVNVTPFVEPRKRTVGRSKLTFTPDTVSGRVFWKDYTDAVERFAAIAKAAGADEFNVGSELSGLDHNPNNAAAWKTLIDRSAAAFGGDVGYTTVYWTFDHPAATKMIWSHPRINVVSVSAYLQWQPMYGQRGLATLDDCRGKASTPATFVDLVRKNFDQWYADRLGKLAAAVGKPVRIGEFGVAPYDTASTVPWQWQFPAGTAYDPTEAANTWAGVLAAVGGHAEIRSIDAWIWGWPGGFGGEPFYLRPDAKNDGPTPFDRTQTNAAMEVLREYASKNNE